MRKDPQWLLSLALLEPILAATAMSTSAASTTASLSSQPTSPVGRVIQEVDDGRRGKGYLFGAFKPADGEALTAPYARLTTANYVDFLERVEALIPPDIERIYAIMDILSAHQAIDVLLFSLAHPRWEFVFQAEICPLSEPDRALVEAVAVIGVKGAALRDLGRGLPSRTRGHQLWECPSSSLSLGATPAASTPPPPRYWLTAESCMKPPDAHLNWRALYPD